ncbi:MAG: hypothetical protein QOG69_3049, partial [Actinomycetota bacterium]|nr:hypothetical protein [Actinomycetota bacterium]
LGSKAAPLLLVAPTGALPAAVTAYLGGVSTGVTGGFAFGGPNAVGADVVTEVSQAIG